jgi:drug/metabolite transporter (DMT)-like permease
MLDPRLLFVAFVWAVNFAFVKYALTDFTPLSFIVVRFALAALFLFVVMLLTREPLGVRQRDIGPLVRLGFIGIAIYNLLFMFGLQYTTASNSALFISTSPLFAALVLAVTERRRISPSILFGLALSSVGVFLVIGSKPGALTFSREDMLGDLLTLCAALFWALYTIQARPLLEKYSPLKVTAYSMAFGTLLLVPLGAGDVLRQSWSTIPAASWGAFAFSTFISAGVAFTLWYQGVKRIGVTRTVVYHYLVPFIAVVFAALFLGERITFVQGLGGCLILAGVYLVQKQKA